MKIIKFPGADSSFSYIKTLADLKEAIYDIVWCVDNGDIDKEYGAELLYEIALVYKKNAK